MCKWLSSWETDIWCNCKRFCKSQQKSGLIISIKMFCFFFPPKTHRCHREGGRWRLFQGHWVGRGPKKKPSYPANHLLLGEDLSRDRVEGGDVGVGEALTCQGGQYFYKLELTWKTSWRDWNVDLLHGCSFKNKSVSMYIVKQNLFSLFLGFFWHIPFFIHKCKTNLGLKNRTKYWLIFKSFFYLFR